MDIIKFWDELSSNCRTACEKSGIFVTLCAPDVIRKKEKTQKARRKIKE